MYEGHLGVVSGWYGKTFWITKVMDTGLPREAFPRNQAFVDISVFPSLGKQQPRFAQGQPKGYFQLKELHKKSLFSNECWLKGGEGPVCWVQCAKMWQDCSLTAVQRKTAFVATDIIHDDLNWRCLDQCHGVRNYGTSSSAQTICCRAV